MSYLINANLLIVSSKTSKQKHLICFEINKITKKLVKYFELITSQILKRNLNLKRICISSSVKFNKYSIIK